MGTGQCPVLTKDNKGRKRVGAKAWRRLALPPAPGAPRSRPVPLVCPKCQALFMLVPVPGREANPPQSVSCCLLEGWYHL